MGNNLEIPITETMYLILMSMVKPNHGYGVMLFVEEKTRGRVLLGPGTLYGAINTLYKKKWIEKVEQMDCDRKKMYVITDMGREILSAETRRMEEVLDIYRSIEE